MTFSAGSGGGTRMTLVSKSSSPRGHMYMANAE